MDTMQISCDEFLTNLERLLKKCTKKGTDYEDKEELRSGLSDLVLIFTKSDPAFKEIMLKFLSTVKCQLFSLLIDFILQEFQGTVMDSVPISLKDPLMLAYYILDNCSSQGLVTPLLDNSFIHTAVHQLRCLEIFLKFNETNIVIAGCLLGILFNCFIHSSDVAQEQALQFSLHHVLPHYVSLPNINVSLLAKTALAILFDYKRLTNNYLSFFLLTSNEFLNLRRGLQVCLEMGHFEVSIIDQRGGLPNIYEASDLLICLNYLSRHPNNRKLLMETDFLVLLQKLLHCEPSDLQSSIMKLLASLCSYHQHAVLVCNEHSEVLSKLEELSFAGANDTVKIEAASTAETIIVSASNVTAGSNEDQELEYFHDDFLSLFKVFIKSITVSLQSPNVRSIASIYKQELKVKMGLVMSLLRLLSLMGEDQVSAVLSDCSEDIKECLVIMCHYTHWMFTGLLKSKKNGFIKITPTHPLPVFHVFYHLMSHSYAFAQKLLLQSGILHLMMDEIEVLTLTPTFDKGTSWFMYVCLAILTNCILELRDSSSSIVNSAVLKPLCVLEEFDYRFPAKVLASHFSTNKKYSKLLTLQDSDIRTILRGLTQAAKGGKISILSPVGSYITFTFSELMQVLLTLLESNPDSCLTLVRENSSLSTLCGLLSYTDTSDQINQLVGTILSHVKSDDAIVAKYLAVFPNCLTTVSAVKEIDDVPLVAKEIEFWLCYVVASMKAVLSIDNDDLDDEFKEHFQETAGLINMDDIALKDRLSAELLELLNYILLSQEGVRAFISSTKEIASFFVTLTAFVDMCCLRVLDTKVPATTLVRLEYILLICQYICQYSETFCITLGETGFAQCLDGVVHALSVHELYADLPQFKMQLSDLCAFIIAVCAHVDGFQGYLLRFKSTLSYYTINRSSFKMWVKCTQCAVQKDSIKPEQYELNDEELVYLFGLISHAVEEETGMAHLWPIFTLTSSHSLLYLFKFCIKLAKCQSNIQNFLKKNVLGLLSLTCQNHEDESLLRVTFQLLERLVYFPGVKDDVLSGHTELITILQAYSERFHEETYFSLHALGIDAVNNTNIPENLLSAVGNMRLGKWSIAIPTLQSLIKKTEDPSTRSQIMKVLGQAAFQQYKEKRLDARINFTICSDDAKQAVGCLGVAYDEGLCKEGDPSLIHLDLTMMDLIYNIPNKPLVRCLLCKRKCADDEKIIRSHIWPESLLRSFVDSDNTPQSMKIFDASWKRFGYLQGPSQITFYMLCAKCEDIFSCLENPFKMHFFNQLHNDPERPSQSTPEEVTVHLLGHPGVQEDWLYRFCLSMIFRVMVVASNGCMNLYGNTSQLYSLFKDCRNILLTKKKVCEIEGHKPGIAMFVTPTHFMSELDLSPFFMKIIFSKGIGSMPFLALHDGNTSPAGQADYVLCSIGDINIIAAANKSCFKFIPQECRVIPSGKAFVIPSALERFLLFPNGLLNEFKSLASSQMSRALHAPSNRLSSKSSTWGSKELQILSQALSDASFASEDRSVSVNFLPPPFHDIKRIGTFNDIIRSSDKFKVLIHFFDHEDTLNNFFLMKAMPSANSDESLQLIAFLHIETNNYNIWMGYHLSAGDLSIMEPLQYSKERTELFLQIEEISKAKEHVSAYIATAVTNAGFRQISHFVYWVTSGIDVVCDVKCNVPCPYCLNVCCVCFKPETSLRVMIDDEISITRVCSQECAKYINAEIAANTTTVSLSINLPSVTSSGCSRKCVFVACTNGVMFGFSKSKLTVFLFEDSTVDHFTVLCQARTSFHQKILLFTVSYKFEFLGLIDESNDKLVQELNVSRLLSTLRDLYESQKHKEEL